MTTWVTPRERAERCPNKESHTPCPNSYLDWHAWAEQMQDTHVVMQCPDCGLFNIWVEKEGEG